tara:strand:+ start:109 stop:297 length:189 start_codon:yes stop_codon:yes gene_type:complete
MGWQDTPLAYQEDFGSTVGYGLANDGFGPSIAVQTRSVDMGQARIKRATDEVDGLCAFYTGT